MSEQLDHLMKLIAHELGDAALKLRERGWDAGVVIDAPSASRRVVRLDVVIDQPNLPYEAGDEYRARKAAA